MSDVPVKPDYRSTVFLPKTDFPMKAGLPQKEPVILAKWQADDAYGQLRAARAGREKFILHDGPPYANGDIHIGHALNHILKDMVVRTQTLLGKDAPYVPGWDCHGLPIEWKVEEQYRKKKLDKDDVPLPEFRAECRAYAQHWVDTQREQLKRLGIGGRWDKPYLTMNFKAEGTIVSELMKFAESGQLYRGAKPVMWSPVEKTALAEAEIEYEDIVSTQVDVAFEIVESPIPELVGAHAVIWTTTPWTIPVNQAIAYGPGVEYIALRLAHSFHEGPNLSVWSGKIILIAADLAENSFKRGKQTIEGQDELWRGKGSDLAGTVARHPMHHLGGFFARPRPFLPGEFVTTDTGTGLVHMSPDHGEDDFDLCKANGIDPVFAVEGDGKYREDWGWLGGQGSVINNKFNAPDGPICSDLRESGGLLAASADYKHSYPHSWRSKAKVIYRCTPQWFVAMDRALDVSTAGLDKLDPALDTNGKSPFGSSSVERSRDAAVENRPLARWENEGGHLATGRTLRETAVRAIADTRFVPEKGRNRIGSMVEGRPDWVLSRQRAWGVPIALFVKRGTNQPLVDPAVNARIVSAIKAGGVDAWSDDRAQEYLGAAYDAANYERVTDILDVWFDSGCTHAFVLESGEWPELQSPADLYLEGSDQHRGWFQSSLLESCGTRGRAPYKAVLTHGFTMDAKGMKMSKSVGNTISPIDLMRDYGADILRLWALSVDFTEDHRIGKEILTGVADQYRKLRNSFRYLLGALDGFDEAERVTDESGQLDIGAMPELERYMLSLLGQLDERMRAAVEAFDFNDYVRALGDFCNEDLSAFYFDIRKDCLYCDAASDPKRRAYRTVLDTLFHALVRYAAPVLVFTSEEVWGTRFPDGGSVHLLEWPDLACSGEGLSHQSITLMGPEGRNVGQGSGLRRSTDWAKLRELRNQVNEAIEPLRREKLIKSSLEAEVSINHSYPGVDLAELFISSTVHQGEHEKIERTALHKCGRCWRHLPEVVEDGDLCGRCEGVVNG